MNKLEIIKKLKDARNKLSELLISIPDERWDEVFLGKWTLKDLAAHFVGWDIENAKSVEEILEGKLPSCFQFEDNNWISYNDVLVSRYKKGGKKELLSAMNKSHISYIQILENIPEKIFDKDVGLRFKEYIITPALNADYEADDEVRHMKQITSWLQSMQ